MNDEPKYKDIKLRIAQLENHVQFEDLFEVSDIQAIQDDFASAVGVASIITRQDGTPITRPSNFCRLCSDIIRKTKKGRINCFKSDAAIGRYNPKGPVIQPCMSGGLWDAGAAISVGGVHIANWLIGQVRDQHQTEAQMVAYANEIDADPMLVLEAFREVPVMSREKFGRIAKLLFRFANQLSAIAYKNLKQTRFIQEMKRIEEKLRISEERYRDIFNAGNDAIFIIDDMSGVVLDVNASMLAMYGYSKSEVIGLPVQKFSSGLEDYDQKGVLQNIIKAKQKKHHVFEWQAKKKNGELFWVEVSLKYSSILNEKKMIAVVRDISERKKTQEVLIQSEKMLSVGGLAAGMAHEINNPLAGMMQNAQVITSRLSNNLPVNVSTAKEVGTSLTAIKNYMEKRNIFKLLKAILYSGERAAKIIENMLAFAHKDNSEKSPGDIIALLDNTIELARTEYDMKSKYDFKQIEIIKEYADNLPMLPCEGTKIQQVFLNIFRNSAQAMQEAKTKCPRFIIRVYSKGSPEMVHVEIEDNGPGMDEKNLSKVFDPFFTTKPVGVGTGLGLSVSYFIITENHNGTMDVISKPGKGANFIIQLPVNRKKSE